MTAPLQPILPAHADPVVAEWIAQMQRQLDAQAGQLDAKEEQLHSKDEQLSRRDQALALAELKILDLEQQLRLERIAKYGKRSETLSDLQLEFLDLEPGVSSEEVAAESEREPIPAPLNPEEQQQASTLRRKHPGRQTFPEHLPRVEKIVSCSAAHCLCSECGEATSVIGYEVTEVLDVKPAEHFVTVIKREKRACRQCEEQGVAVAAVPERILDKSLVSDQVVIDTIVAKYCDSLPLYRQSAMLARDTGVQISRSTMDGWVMKVGELLLPLVSRMKHELLRGSYIQADETPVGVQVKNNSGKNHQAYLWQYGSPGKGVVFDFRMGREREGPKLFLGDFSGILQTDGYAAYDRVGGPGMIHACCLAHARRKFVDAVKVAPTDKDSACIVALMDALFAIDRTARELNMSPAERHLLRQQKAPALLAELREKTLAMQKTALPKSAAGKAAHYTLALWTKLTRFLEHPELELSTNLAENSMRPIAIGRKNWIHLGSPQAGPKIAAIFSVVESCRRLKIPIRPYLADVLPGLANRNIQTLDGITPEAYAVKIPS